jgi:arylsulfatase A-like enzyme
MRSSQPSRAPDCRHGWSTRITRPRPQTHPSLCHPPQVNTPNNIKNLATAAKDAGYSVIYKGKMHLSKPINDDYTWSSADALKYNWTR